jgi:hypothetical protein
MGWHFILDFRCKLLPEYVDFIKNKCFTVEPFGETYDSLPRTYRELIDIWSTLDLDDYNDCGDLKEDNGTFIYSCQISKKVNRHMGDLWQDYETLMKQIIVPMSSVVFDCTIESDDYGDRVVHYTDGELRGWRFDVPSLIKRVEHEWADGRVVASRIVYKRSIPQEHVADLDRFFR